MIIRWVYIKGKVSQLIPDFMASLLRTAKSASDWKQNDLRTYNIVVRNVDPCSFFGREPTNLPESIESFRVAHHWQDVDDNFTMNLLRMLWFASGDNLARESAVDDFMMMLFVAIGYTSRTRFARSRRHLSLIVCGEYRQATPDICLLDDQTTVLLVQEDKYYVSDTDPEPQLIAEAIGAFQENDILRRRMSRPIRDHVTIPGITMRGTLPVFYKIEVTSELADAVAAGIYPPHETVVLSCAPPCRPELSGTISGMRDLEFREIALKYFEAFKQFID